MRKEYKLGEGFINIRGNRLYLYGRGLTPIYIDSFKEFNCYCKSNCQCEFFELVARPIKNVKSTKQD